MTATEIIKGLGGTKVVMDFTKLSKGRISQWRTENHIPRSWRIALETWKPGAFVSRRARARRRMTASAV